MDKWSSNDVYKLAETPNMTRITIFKCLNIVAFHIQMSEGFFFLSVLNVQVNITIQLVLFSLYSN